ncbi:hypothetical protein K7887_17805 [Sutcliffiella horikoshii]|uniref:hypothetical protein n=1 Tax=Sutcliffiella horikoshii TaxID=79883 RepID=UPI001CBDC2CF|nr:hypothetical protein [Sutcliffiella horikoshii]UAL46705.1 hypothetical protein K7887_17805 [Sutcliffiella horikoshii]
MVKRKAAVALSIFSTLFAGAWWLSVEQKRDYVDHYYNGDSSIVLIGSNQQGSSNVIQPFKPREYIRIVVAKKENEEVEVEPT